MLYLIISNDEDEVQEYAILYKLKLIPFFFQVSIYLTHVASSWKSEMRMGFADSLSWFDCRKKASKPRFRVWTFPVLVDGPFGVVSVAEFIGIFLVGVFVVYGCAAYIIRNWHKISQYEASAFYKRYDAI